MYGLKYPLSIWLIGIFTSPIITYALSGFGHDFLDIYFMMVLWGGFFSIISLFIFMGIFHIIEKNYETSFQIKLVTQIVVIVLTILTFFIAFPHINSTLIIVIPYLFTMSLSVWILNPDSEKRDDYNEINDDFL